MRFRGKFAQKCATLVTTSSGGNAPRLLPSEAELFPTARRRRARTWGGAGRGVAGFAVFVVNVLVVTAFKSLEKIPT